MIFWKPPMGIFFRFTADEVCQELESIRLKEEKWHLTDKTADLLNDKHIRPRLFTKRVDGLNNKGPSYNLRFIVVNKTISVHDETVLEECCFSPDDDNTVIVAHPY